MAIRLETLDSQCTLRLESEVDINCANELKRSLFEALSSSKALRIDFSGLAELDISAVQLLWAAKREAEKAGVAFALVGAVPESVAGTLRGAGFEELLATDSITSPANSNASSTVSSDAR